MPAMILYGLGLAFTVWMAVVCVRRGQAGSWLWIILLFPTIGATIYFLSEYVDFRSFGRIGGSVKASRRELQRTAAEVRRLDNCEAWTDYASALRSRNRFEEARAAAERAVGRDVHHLRARYELGLAQLGAGRFQEAVESLARVVEQAPLHDSGEAPFALAVAYDKAGRKEDALRTLERLAATTSLPKVLYALASIQAELGQKEQARETLQRIIHEADFVPDYHRREVRPWVKKAKRALGALA